MRTLLFSACMALTFISCNDAEQSSTSGNREDTVTIPQDIPGDTRGQKGTGVDNSGGTPGPGTITDTFQGKTDTSDHTSGRER